MEKTIKFMSPNGNIVEEDMLWDCGPADSPRPAPPSSLPPLPRASFRQMFRQAEFGQLDRVESHAVFTAIEKKVSKLIFKDHIIVTVTTFVNSGHSLMKNCQSKHTIAQEAGKADNGELFIALAQCGGDHESFHFSGDPLQLGPQDRDEKGNPFARQTKRSLYQRLISSGYTTKELSE